MMQHLNYCRQMVKQFLKFAAIPNQPPENRAILSHAIDLAAMSTKFLLPTGGRLYDDKTFRALDENEPLRLPYPAIALEYEAVSGGYVNPGQTDDCPKRIMFAREREGGIVVMPVVYHQAAGCWGPLPEAFLPSTGFLDRSKTEDGRCSIMLAQADRRIPLSDYGDEVGALLCFLNTLQCTNVHIERSAPTMKGKALKRALPFDEYHILTVDTTARAAAPNGCGETHRSPREHLRRGHIRRLESGARVWVNATVVNPGVGGKVSKDYAIA